MPLKGHLRDLSLVQLLNLISLSKRTGTLTILDEETGVEHVRLAFKEGKLVYAVLGSEAADLTTLLYKAGKLNDEQARAINERHEAATDKAVAQLLINANYVTQADIISSVQQHALGVVQDIMQWREGAFQFDENTPPPDDSILVPIELENVIIEGSRRMRESQQLSETLPNLDAPIRFPNDSQTKFKGVRLSVEEWRVISHIDPKDTIRQIAEKANLSDMEVRRIVYGLEQAGLVEIAKEGQPASPPQTPSAQSGHVANLMDKLRDWSGQGEAAPEASGTPESSSPIQFSAYYPKTMRRDDWQPLYAYVFHEDAASSVVADAFNQLGEKQASYSTVTQPGRTPIVEGAEITATPRLPGFQFNPLTVTIGFYDAWSRFDFKLRAKDAPLNQFTAGAITFTVKGVIVADIPISVYVGEVEGIPEVNTAITRLYQSIFCSYSHKDIRIVERVERAYKALGLDYLRDITTLKSGSSWNAQLLDMIDRADIFQLFWSPAAAESPYVQQEWKHALKYERERTNFIRPVYWQQPMPEPPPELNHIHFAYMPDLARD